MRQESSSPPVLNLSRSQSRSQSQVPSPRLSQFSHHKLFAEAESEAEPESEPESEPEAEAEPEGEPESSGAKSGLYADCGSSKSCLGVPDKCIEKSNCRLFASWKK